MSSFLYRIGGLCFNLRRRVVAIWLAILILFGTLTLFFGGKFDDTFTIPGAPSQSAYDQLKMSFPAAAQVTADLVVVVPPGETVFATERKTAVLAGLEQLKSLDFVADVVDPYDTPISGLISADNRAVLVKILLQVDTMKLTDGMRSELIQTTSEIAEKLPGAEVKIGGFAFSIELPRLSFVEGIGVGLAVIVLMITLGSVTAATFPLLSALVGAGISVMSIVIAAGIAQINSTTMILALMLALAVGIDYSLLIIARHRDQLKQGMAVAESVARAVGTSGSAVLFAGLTVIAALIGLSLSGIPFLTVMGVFAALAVALEVCLSVTLLPALMGFAGERLRPKINPKTEKFSGAKIANWWMSVVTTRPIIVVFAVLLFLGVLTLPITHLQMALPNPGRHLKTQVDRQTFDLVKQEFGPGYNGVLVVTAPIAESTNPLELAESVKKDVESLPGVAKVLIATPNQNADTLMVQIVPETGPDDPRTEKLVQDLRNLAPKWKTDYGIDATVTGFTAMAIDVSNRLAKALLPFALFVVGISLVLLTMVFRSIWVPIKAALGYLFSVGAAFGATTLVFNDGWGKNLINLPEPIPIISFLPIIAMGILFGLAMDYEVFLVSRMREEYVHGNRENWIQQGFIHSSRVVVAAAVIMFSVFLFFVPSSQGPVKPIAFALAVGVALDAFVVRMTLVPAVMALLGKRSWQISSRLNRILPVMDIEGESLSRILALQHWPANNQNYIAYGEGLTVAQITAFQNLDLAIKPGEIAVFRGSRMMRQAWLYALSGRLILTSGRAKVAGFVLPELAAQVRKAVPCLVNPSLKELIKAQKSTSDFLVMEWPVANADQEIHEAAWMLLQSRIADKKAIVIGCDLNTDLASKIEAEYGITVRQRVLDSELTMEGCYV